MGAQLTINNVGWTYIGVTIAWTVILFSAMGFLWYHRRLPQLQMRRLPLVFIAMTMLHIYWVLCMIGYVIGPVAPCAAEYWMMSILVPFGIAMFQIANTQFLYIASQQKQFINVCNPDDIMRQRKMSVLDGRTGSLWHRTSRRLKNVDQITRMVIFVGIGMIIQALLSLLIFLLSRKFHPDFGVLPVNLFGTDAEQRMECSRGWEWWLSIVWQFFWAWLYAPYILWKSRNVQDTHGWRIQTILCCIAGLPCSPLWLCGLYLPQFAPVNAVFIPPNWFSLSIFFIQSFTVFIPCYQIYRHHHLRSETLAAIANWEAKNKRLGSGTVDSGTTHVGSLNDFSYKACGDSEKGLRVNSIDQTSITSRKSHLYTMIALEHALMWNPDPLQKFAALKDFSGENISFLTHLTNWKKTWTTQRQSVQTVPVSVDQLQYHHQPQHDMDEDQLREAYNRAISLYAVYVSHEHAEFPINLSCRTLRRLDAMFARASNILFGDGSSQGTVNSATPFDLEHSKSVTMSDVRETRNDSASTGVLCLDDVYYWGEIPEAFAAGCFDDAEQEIKYLVLTNTWPKFVSAGYAEQIRDAQGTSLGKRLSQHFYWKRYK